MIRLLRSPCGYSVEKYRIHPGTYQIARPRGVECDTCTEDTVWVSRVPLCPMRAAYEEPQERERQLGLGV